MAYAGITGQRNIHKNKPGGFKLCFDVESSRLFVDVFVEEEDDTSRTHTCAAVSFMLQSLQTPKTYRSYWCSDRNTFPERFIDIWQISL